MILDSGERRQFETGAVRDIQEGKGRCDLLPLGIVGEYLKDPILKNIDGFITSGRLTYIKQALDIFVEEHYHGDRYTMLLEDAKHFEEGAKKYGDNNWQKGINTRHYIDSAVRHYLKWRRGDKDESHDRAFAWNLLCCVWTCVNKPELNDYKKEEAENGQSTE